MEGKDFRSIFERLPFWIILVAALFFGVRELGLKEGEEKSALSEVKKLKTITKKIPKRAVLNVSEVKEKAPAKVPQKPFTIQIAAFKDKAVAKKMARFNGCIILKISLYIFKILLHKENQAYL